MNICIAIWNLTLSAGGIGKVGVTLVKELMKKGHQLTVLSNSSNINLGPYYELPEGTAFINSKWVDTPTCRKTIRKAILGTHPDVVIAMMVGPPMKWWPHILNGTDIPLILSEHSNPWRIEQEMWERPERQLVMAFADKIHFLLPSFTNSVESYLQDKVTTIPNPIESDDVIPNSEIIKNRTIITVGRLEDDVKQVSLLIKAFNLLTPDFPDWKLRIIGGDVDGSETLYRNLIHKFGIESSVELTGEIENLNDIYMKATILCHPSRYEGFGLVVIEGYKYGLPAVGFRECSGINELIIDNETGILVDSMDENSLATGLRKLMENENLVLDMSKNALIEVKKYNISIVVEMWLDLIASLLSENTNERGNLVDDSETHAPNLLVHKNKFLKRRYLNRTSLLRSLAKELFTLLLIVSKKMVRITRY